MKTVSDLKVAIFADGAEKAGMLEMYAKPYIKGFTTNPTLMRKAGVTDYEKFARERFCRKSPTGRFLSRFSRMILPRWRGKHVKSRPGAQTSESRSLLLIRVRKALCRCASD